MLAAPPGLLTTTTGTSTSFFSVMSRCTKRAVASPPVPADVGTTISMLRAGFHPGASPACAANDIPRATKMTAVRAYHCAAIRLFMKLPDAETDLVYLFL